MSSAAGFDDAMAMADAARELYDVHATRRNDLSIELYRRTALTIRVAVDSRGETMTRAGKDEGVSVLIADRSSTGAGFAAAAGWGPESVAWAIDRAQASRLGSRRPRLAATASRAPAQDVEPGLRLPAPSRLEAWIVPAIKDLRRHAGLSLGTGAGVRGWIEAGVVVEVIVGAEGLWVRGRTRVWAAMLAPDRALPDAKERPRIVVAKALEALDGSTWGDSFGCQPNIPRTPSHPPAIPIILEPEPSATLIQAAIGARMAGWIQDDTKSGPGLAVVDDPTSGDAILGGTFDDRGYATHRVELVGGGRWGGLPLPEGLYRRSSYRDRPVPIPSALRFEGTEVGVPVDHYRVGSLRILSIEQGKWVVEVEGERRRDGEVVEILHGARVHAAPADLLEGCLGGTGQAVPATWAVRTPALVFEGWKLSV